LFSVPIHLSRIDPLHGDPRFEALVQNVVAPKIQ